MGWRAGSKGARRGAKNEGRPGTREKGRDERRIPAEPALRGGCRGLVAVEGQRWRRQPGNVGSFPAGAGQR